jgi:hypothetical protein
MAVNCPGRDGMKTRAGRLAEAIARGRYTGREHAVERITYASGGYYYDEAKDQGLLKAVKAEMIKVRREEAAVEMRKRLRECANRIEGLRVLLPNLAALACIEFGHVARGMHLEASNGETV